MDSGVPTASSTFFSSSIIFFGFLILSECATDTLTRSGKISVGQTLTSAGQVFELGFFAPGDSKNQYLGMWYKNLAVRKYVWVANRENPLSVTDSASSLTIGSDGNLILEDSNKDTVWSTEVPVKSNNTVAVLSDGGNFVLKDNLTGLTLWQSFDSLTDTFLAGMMVGINMKTGKRNYLSSWESEDDPSVGNFVFGLSPDSPPQAFIWNGSRPYWRSGPWDGSEFIGVKDSARGYVNGLNVITDNNQGSVYLTYNIFDTSYASITVMSSAGTLETIDWHEKIKDWRVSWAAPVEPCDVYGVCGPFGVCTKNASPICQCLEGFVPKSDEDWSRGNWTGGCVRRTELKCQTNISSTKNDGFRKLSDMKLPDHFVYLYNKDSNGCETYCLGNCTCVAYSYVAGIGCLVWTGDLVDMQQFSNDGNDLLLRLAHSDLGKNNSKMKKITVSFTVSAAVILLGAILYGLWKWRTNGNSKEWKRIGAFNLAHTRGTPRDEAKETRLRKQDKTPESQELPLIDFDKIVVATDNFSSTNKLGAGGFGSVYKGKLEDGQEVAVKRLSSSSGQGAEEFKNETILISKLRHRNLVRLLGCCIHGEEKLLVYEYMKNRSLDTLLFDTKKREELDWAKRFNIIQGIARGILYLHRDSCLRVIHRDLKASNILLDDDMNPKVSDFGLARTFRATEELANTHRVVGTFGYMSPEYVMGGLFSEKSDVFSFGVLLLEIVSGTRNTSFHYNDKHLNLLGYAWQLWTEEKSEDLIDTKVVDSCSKLEATKCIHIGLLCVQERAIDRPTMSDVVFMLGSEVELPPPKQAAFTTQSWSDPTQQPSQYSNVCSINQVTESIVQGR